MYKVFLVGAGGFFGAMARYLVSGWVSVLGSPSLFPFGTLTVNVLGCLLIGILGGLVELRQVFSPEVRVILLIGFLGGFTTFSTFGFETLQLSRDDQIATALFYVFLQLALGLGATWLGFVFAKLY